MYHKRTRGYEGIRVYVLTSHVRNQTFQHDSPLRCVVLIKMPNGWRTIKSLVHKIPLHGRRGKGMAESFSREKLRHAPQKEGGRKILCDLPPVWPRLVRPTNLMSRMNGKKTQTHTTKPHVEFLKKKTNASKLFEHPPSQGGDMP